MVGDKRTRHGEHARQKMRENLLERGLGLLAVNIVKKKEVFAEYAQILAEYAETN